MALVAVAVVYLRIVAPLLQAESVDMDEELEFIPDDVSDLSLDGSSGRGDPAVGLEFVSAQYDIGHFSTTDLHWNEKPERDPFSPHVQINQNDVNAVLDKVKNPIKQFSRVVRVSLPVVSAIVNSERYRYAVVDGEILSVGERAGDFVLRGIEHHSVTLQRRSNQQTFKVMVKE